MADDDFFYPRDMLQRLVKMHNKYPSDIIASSVQIIAPTIISLPSVWLAPINGERYVSSREAQAFTGAGSLFPAKWYSKEVFNSEKAMELASTADDLWLKAMSLCAEIRTTAVYPVRGFPVQIQIKNNHSLYLMNNADGGNMNDRIWASLLEEYDLKDFDVCSR